MRNLNILISIYLLISLSGCGGFYSNQYKVENGYTSNEGFTILPNQETSTSLARAELIRSQAALNYRMAELMGKDDGINSGNHFVGIIINDDPRKTAFVSHPEMSQKIVILPENFSPIYTKKIPKEISVYNSSGNYRIFRPDLTGGTYNGLNYVFGLRLYKL